MLPLLAILPNITDLFTDANATVTQLMAAHGYLAVFGLMLVEGASLPVPSEIVLPLAGYFAAKGTMNVFLAFVFALLGSTGGLIIDYTIGYVIGKDIVYKHLERFHVKKSSLDAFDTWFARNGVAAVFFSRLIPVLRTLMSFPAGFAKMPLKKFFLYSITGSVIWDSVLIAFGYYLLSAKSAEIVMAAIGVFAIVMYVVFKLAMKRIRH
ncbi:MAG: DedA family protein [Candidatus Micrarchaeota archaeon]|nr:DedA family protein [Candidatus Micrarchaeota archaeon]